MAALAQRLAAAGVPVFRYDRRGVGDSTGENGGFEASADDLAAAATTFRHETSVTRVVAFGNCDAAAALALFHGEAGIDALVLANPWTIEESDSLPPASAIRARYLSRLKDPRSLWRLVTGGVDLGKLLNGLRKVSAKPSQTDSSLAQRIAQSLGDFEGPVTALIARGDNTALAFVEAWQTPAFAALRSRATMIERDTASHSFAPATDKDWLFEQLLAAVHSAA